MQHQAYLTDFIDIQDSTGPHEWAWNVAKVVSEPSTEGGPFTRVLHIVEEKALLLE